MNKHELAAYVRENLIEAQRRLAAGEPIEGKPIQLSPIPVVAQTGPTVDLSVERGTHYPDVAPSLPGETDAQYTDRLTGADGTGRRPYDHDRNRQCSIGYHLECSDPQGETCKCPCHLDRIEGGTTATNPAATLGRLYYLPVTTAKNVMQGVRAKVMQRAILGAADDDTPDDLMSFEEVRDIIGEIRPHYSRPGKWFTVDVLKVGGLDKFVRGMP